MTPLTGDARRWALLAPSAIGIPAIVATWVFMRLAAIQQPGYDSLRDTISSLASEGATLAWLGMLTISVAGAATILASIPLRRVSQPAALALGVAGMALFVVAFTRIACPEGAAGCEMRTTTAHMTAEAHIIALVVFEIALTGAVASTALCLWRAGARTAAVIGIVAIVLSIGFFAVVPLDVGTRQRLWLLVNSVLIGVAHVVRLPTDPAVRRSTVAPRLNASESGRA
jgi:hypothetical protein